MRMAWHSIGSQDKFVGAVGRIGAEFRGSGRHPTPHPTDRGRAPTPHPPHRPGLFSGLTARYGGRSPEASAWGSLRL